VRVKDNHTVKDEPSDPSSTTPPES